MKAQLVAAGFGAAAMLLTACGSEASDSASSPTAAAQTTAAATSGECPLSVSDAWVKAADSGMTAAFGAVVNTSDRPVTITGASTPAAGMTELHQTIEENGTAKMQQVSAFNVEADNQLTLMPGGDHLMLMDLTGPIAAGDDVNITLNCKDAGTVSFTAQARTYAGANESYDPNGEMDMDMDSDSGEMDMSTPGS